MKYPFLTIAAVAASMGLSASAFAQNIEKETGGVDIGGDLCLPLQNAERYMKELEGDQKKLETQKMRVERLEKALAGARSAALKAKEGDEAEAKRLGKTDEEMSDMRKRYATRLARLEKAVGQLGGLKKAVATDDARLKADGDALSKTRDELAKARKQAAILKASNAKLQKEHEHFTTEIQTRSETVVEIEKVVTETEVTEVVSGN